MFEKGLKHGDKSIRMDFFRPLQSLAISKTLGRKAAPLGPASIFDHHGGKKSPVLPDNGVIVGQPLQAIEDNWK